LLYRPRASRDLSPGEKCEQPICPTTGKSSQFSFSISLQAERIIDHVKLRVYFERVFTTDQRESILGAGGAILPRTAGFSFMLVRSDPIW
jgi:hypothetical protein